MRLPTASLAASAFLFALLGLPAATAAVVADLQSTLSFNLKLTTGFVTASRTVSGGQVEETSKHSAIRLTQRDLLLDLIEDGLIAGPLSGWSLVARATSDTADNFDYNLVAVKRGQPDYVLAEDDSEVLDLQIGPMPLAYKVRYQGETIVSGSGTALGSFIGSFNSDGESLNLAGTIRAPFSYKRTAFNGGFVNIFVPGKVTLTTLGGAELNDPELGYLPTVIEGSFTFSPHTITAVRDTTAVR